MEKEKEREPIMRNPLKHTHLTPLPLLGLNSLNAKPLRV
jgi:hypothetical protein